MLLRLRTRGAIKDTPCDLRAITKREHRHCALPLADLGLLFCTYTLTLIDTVTYLFVLTPHTSQPPAAQHLRRAKHLHLSQPPPRPQRAHRASARALGRPPAAEPDGVEGARAVPSRL